VRWTARYVQGMATAVGAPGYPWIAGAAYLACVPPSGNKDMIFRFLLRDPIGSIKITW
jgi:hypothetical protein